MEYRWKKTQEMMWMMIITQFPTIFIIEEHYNNTL